MLILIQWALLLCLLLCAADQLEPVDRSASGTHLKCDPPHPAHRCSTAVSVTMRVWWVWCVCLQSRCVQLWILYDTYRCYRIRCSIMSPELCVQGLVVSPIASRASSGSCNIMSELLLSEMLIHVSLYHSLLSSSLTWSPCLYPPAGYFVCPPTQFPINTSLVEIMACLLWSASSQTPILLREWLLTLKQEESKKQLACLDSLRR